MEFRSETDTETIAHLIEKFYAVEKDLFRAVQKTLQRLKGAHGLVVMSADEPDRLIAARLGNAGGVAIGVGEGEMFIASDVPAIVEERHEQSLSIWSGRPAFAVGRKQACASGARPGTADDAHGAETPGRTTAGSCRS